MYHKCTSQRYPPLSNQLSILCYRRDPGLAAGQAPPHPTHKCTGTCTISKACSLVQSSLSYNYTLSFTGSHQVLVGVPQSPFERSREVSQGWLDELSSSEYLCHLLQCLAPHLPVLVTQVTHKRGSDLGTGGGGEGEGKGRGRGGGGGGKAEGGGEGEGKGRGEGEEGEGRGRRGGSRREGKEWGAVNVRK